MFYNPIKRSTWPNEKQNYLGTVPLKKTNKKHYANMKETRVSDLI